MAEEQPNQEAEVVDEIQDLSPNPELPNLPMTVPVWGRRCEVPARIMKIVRSGVSHVKIHVNTRNFSIEVTINEWERYRKEFSRESDHTTKVKTEWWRGEESGQGLEKLDCGSGYDMCVLGAIYVLGDLLEVIGSKEVGTLEVILEDLSDEDEDPRFVIQKKEFLEKVEVLLQNRVHRILLKVNKFIIEYGGSEEQEVLSFIPYLNFVGKKAVHFRRSGTGSQKHVIEQTTRLGVWAGLKKLTIEEPFWTEMSITNWKHFTDVTMMREELEEDLLREIVAIASKTSHYSCIIKTMASKPSVPVLQFVATLDADSPTSFTDPSTGLQVDIYNNVYTFRGPSVRSYVYPLVRIVLHPDHSSFRKTSRDRKSIEDLFTVKTFPNEPSRVGCNTKHRVLTMDCETKESLALPTYQLFAYHIDQCKCQLRNLDRFANMYEIENMEVSVAHAPDDERYNKAIREFFEKAKDLLEEREHRLKVHKFVMEYSDEGQVKALLPYLELVGTKEIHLRKAVVRGEVPKELMISEVIKMRQWRQARKISMFGGWTRWSDDWRHLEKSRIVLEKIDVEVVENILQIARTSDTFVSCTIETIEPPQNPEVVQHVKSVEVHPNGIQVILSDNLYIFKRNR